MKKAIDISAYQTNVDYTKVKNDGIEMAILRVGYTGYGVGKSKNKDSMFETHYKGFKNVGIPVGVYWYSCAYTEEEAIIEANKVLEYVKGKQIELPIFIDVEDEHNINASGCARENQVTIGKEKLTKVVEAFCKEIEKNGYYVGIYASTYWLNTRLDMNILEKYDIWVAHWWVSKPTYNGKYGVWQYSSTGRVNGINGNVDLDYVYKDYPTLIKNNKLNHLDNNIIENTDTEITYEVVRGDTLSDIAMKFNTNYKLIAEYNHISNPNLIHVGQILKIPRVVSPKATYYIVRKGDTLSDIALRYNTNWKVIYEKNKETIGNNPDLIYPGQKLII